MFASSSTSSCLLYYNRSANTLNLEKDDGSYWTGAPAGHHHGRQ